MPRISYVTKRFRADSEAIIAQADDICRAYAAQGFTLTLRQLYYQFVSKNLLANKQSNYDRLGAILNDARLAGRLDWAHIEDRTRSLKSLASWSSPQSILGIVADQYRRNVWDDQPTHVEVWIEKEALVGVIEGVCNQNRVSYFACRGYVSQSEAWQAAQRYVPMVRNGRSIVILHLGDHDPSGMDMTRDIEDRLNLFVGHHTGGWGPVTIRRIALNMDQIEQYDPPPNPAKWSDSRAAEYVARYGESSWELDALEPTIIGALIDREIDALRDDALWFEALAREERERTALQHLVDRYDEVRDFLDVA